MNSEITNVSKLSPLTILSNKQSDLKEASIATVQQPIGGAKDGLKEQAADLKLDAQAQEASLAAVKEAAAKGNAIFQETNRDLEFHVDDSTKKVVVKIIDSKSGDVVQQIPTEDMMTYIKRMQELDGGQGAMLQDRA